MRSCEEMKAAVAVAFVAKRVVKVEEELFRSWMVEEPRAMSDPEMVTNPDGATLKRDVVAEPAAFVVDAMSKRFPREPGVSSIASFAYGGKAARVEVPICKRFAVLSQVKAASEERLVALVQKVT